MVKLLLALSLLSSSAFATTNVDEVIIETARIAYNSGCLDYAEISKNYIQDENIVNVCRKLSLDFADQMRKNMPND